MPDSLTPVEEKREVHLLDYWRTIWRGRWTILSIFVVVFTLVAIGTFTQKPSYRAQATVEITPQSRKVSPVAEAAETGMAQYGWFAEERYFNTQYEIIKSRDIARRVFDRLDLYNHPLFKESTDPIGEFTQMILVAPVKDTGIVQVSMEGLNPEEVATWVNTISEAYVDRNLDQAVEVTSKSVKALLSEIAPLKEKLEDSQRTSFEFAEKANLYVPENQQKITNDRLSTLQSELTETQVKRGEIEGLLKQIDSNHQSGGAYESIPQISGDPVVRELYASKVGLEREYERLLVTYKDKHIRVQEKQKEIEETTQKIASEVDRIIMGLRSQYDLLKDRETKLVRAIDETRSESLQVNRKASSYEMVRGEATETKRIYDLISTRVKEIDLSSSLMSNNLRILDKAPVPKVPVRPRTVLNLTVGLLLGLFLGVGMVFFLDYMDNTVRTAEDVEQYLRLNLLAIVPKQAEGTHSAVKEAYQTLRTSLLFSRKHRGANTVLITSAGPQEGKSCTAVNVARTLATAGEKVIIVDCDLRRPAIHTRLNLSRDGGVTNYILSTQGDDWRTYVKSTDQSNLFALTCGPIPPNPADVFGHERFVSLLKELRAEFDWVFIDSPPVVSLADSMILASLADMVAFVIRHNENDKELIRRCVMNVRKINPNVIGAVLNSIDLDRSHYKDYYYVGYYYYGESSSTKKSRKRRTSPPIAAVTDPDSEDKVTRIVG
ncbi:MAG TPA: polysaccharide biosynthesis tyrosine autokinase [Candidatus Dormibacteraeota bacterium]|nr:polysaccharide biosynthesis tyrosine autokinase [Candidatus Dormibacteraeota bacterium]